MNIAKAIKRNKKLREESGLLPYIDGIQLGIEALERLKELREKTPTPIYLIEKPLPSEGEK